MGKRNAGDGGEEVDGERLRAESADDQDHKERRRFDELIERLGPVKFRRLADEAYDAHGKGDGTMDRHGVMQDLDDGADMRAYTQKLLHSSPAQQQEAREREAARGREGDKRPVGASAVSSLPLSLAVSF